MTANKAFIGVVITAVISALLVEPIRDFAITSLIGTVQMMNSIIIGQMPVDSPYLSSMNLANSLLGLVLIIPTISGLLSFVAFIAKYIK